MFGDLYAALSETVNIRRQPARVDDGTYQNIANDLIMAIVPNINRETIVETTGEVITKSPFSAVFPASSLPEGKKIEEGDIIERQNDYPRLFVEGVSPVLNVIRLELTEDYSP